MKKFITILFSFLVALQLNAQPKPIDSDSIHSRLATIDSTGTQVDSLTQFVQATTDSITSRLDSILSRPGGYVDSLRMTVISLTSKLDKAQSRVKDSLNSLMSSITDRSIGRAPTKVDSISDEVAMGSIRADLDSINGIDPTRGFQSRIDEQKTKIEGQTSSVADKFNQKLDVFSKQSQGQGILPEDANAPALPGGNLPQADLPEVDLPKPDLDIEADIKLPQIKSGDIDAGKGFNHEMKFPTESVPKVNSVEMKGVSNEVSSLSENVSGVSKDIHGLRQGDPDAIQAVEKKAVSSLPIGDEMAAIQSQEQLIEEKRREIERLQKREEYKKQTIARAKMIVNQHLAAYEGQLKESMKKVSAYQNKMGTILNKRSDLPKRRDPLRKLRTFEKFVPGLTFQFQNSGARVADLNLSIRYRLTSYWSAGTGWNQRIIFDDDRLGSYEGRVYGVRSFSEVIIFKGIAARLEVEAMSMFIASDVGVNSVGSRAWVWNYVGGVKKEFTFLPRISGNVQFMYTAYSSSRHNPYPSRFNVRFGFERSLKKRSRK